MLSVGFVCPCKTLKGCSGLSSGLGLYPAVWSPLREQTILLQDVSCGRFHLNLLCNLGVHIRERLRHTAGAAAEGLQRIPYSPSHLLYSLFRRILCTGISWLLSKIFPVCRWRRNFIKVLSQGILFRILILLIRITVINCIRWFVKETFGEERNVPDHSWVLNLLKAVERTDFEMGLLPGEFGPHTPRKFSKGVLSKVGFPDFCGFLGGISCAGVTNGTPVINSIVSRFRRC